VFIYLCFQGYKVFYTTNPDLPISFWESQDVKGDNHMAIISGLTPNKFYTVSVLAYSSMGQGPTSSPVQMYLLECRDIFLLIRFVCWDVGHYCMQISRTWRTAYELRALMEFNHPLTNSFHETKSIYCKGVFVRNVYLAPSDVIKNNFDRTWKILLVFLLLLRLHLLSRV